MRRRGDSGSVVETVLLLPVFVLLMLLVVGAGRVGSARADVEDAARAGAREASYGSSDAMVDRATRSSLELRGVRCQRAAVELQRPQPSSVRVTVSCEVDLGDLAGLPLPGTATISGSAVEPVDPGRQR